MYEAYWGLGSPPFQNVPDPGVYYPSSQHEEALTRLLYAVRGRKGAAMLTGEVGSGKTTLSRILIGQLISDGYAVGVVTHPSLPHTEFMKELHFQLGIESPRGRSRYGLLRGFESYLFENSKKGVDTVVVVDEAQLIRNAAIFEELRLLLNFHLNNRFLLTLILIGQPELLGRVAAARQFAQRVGIRCHLGALGRDDTGRYVSYRMGASGGRDGIFADGAIDELHGLTGGVPRRINNVCDLALLAGFAAGADRIDAETLRSVAGEALIGAPGE